jgi:hypothetical protein
MLVKEDFIFNYGLGNRLTNYGFTIESIKNKDKIGNTIFIIALRGDQYARI